MLFVETNARKSERRKRENLGEGTWRSERERERGALI